MKLSPLVIDTNLNELFNKTESAARSSLESVLPKLDKNVLKLHAYLTTQYIVQFAVQKFVKSKSSIHQNHNLKIRRMLRHLTIEKINQIDHPAKHLAITAAGLLIRQKIQGAPSNIWMLDQLSLISSLKESEAMKLFPAISNLMQIEIVKCEAGIKKTTYPAESHQGELYVVDANDATVDATTSKKRNVVNK